MLLHSTNICTIGETLDISVLLLLPNREPFHIDIIVHFVKLPGNCEEFSTAIDQINSFKFIPTKRK